MYNKDYNIHKPNKTVEKHALYFLDSFRHRDLGIGQSKTSPKKFSKQRKLTEHNQHKY